MLEQLHRYTHENINTLSIRKLFSAVLAIYFTVQFNDKSDYINWKQQRYGDTVALLLFVEKVFCLMCFCYIVQPWLWYQATDSSVCRTALLGFAIRVDTLVNMKEGDNQRDQGEGLPPLSLSLRFSPSWLPLSLSIPLPRWGVGWTR